MWRFVGGAVEGTSHRRTGTPCQDVFSYATLPEGVGLLVAADGAGSAPKGQVGADVAVRAACDACFIETASGLEATESSLSRLVQEAFKAAREGLENASGDSSTLGDFATTLQVLLVAPHCWAYGGVGDGGAVGRQDVSIRALSPRPPNVYVNETVFLSSDFEVRVASGSESLTAAAMFTDGLERLAMRVADWTPHAAFFHPLFRLVEDPGGADTLLRLLRSDRFTQRTDDDCTLVLCVKSNGHL